MTEYELREMWPNHWSTHDISDGELNRIAHAANDVQHAQWIWENENWWRDANG